MRLLLPPSLLLLSLAGRPALGQVPAPVSDCPEQACPAPRWEAPRIAGAYDLLPGAYRPLQVVVEPVSWNLGGWNLGPVVALSAPVALDGVTLDAWHLQLGAWWMPAGPTVRWRVGPEAGLCLRSYEADEQALARDWLPALGARVGMSWLVLERWRVEPGLRLVGELPLSELTLLDALEPVPMWHAQVLLGIHLPTPGR